MPELFKYELWIPGLPQNLVSPNRARRDYNARAAMTRKAKIDFSRQLEDLWPREERPESPLTSAWFDIWFHISGTKDPDNTYARLKPWTDEFVQVGILKDDSFHIIQKVTLQAKFNVHEPGIQWLIQGR